MNVGTMLSFIPAMENHFAKLLAARKGVESPDEGRMWPSAVDTRTGLSLGREHVPARVYRLIGAPGGSTLYWDMPLVVAAYALNELTGKSEYAAAADLYVRSFLERCVGDDGVFLWGNHMYYDLTTNEVVRFSGGHHELRPITPAWEVLWRCDPRATESYIRAMVRKHVHDASTGGFNRHDDGKKSHAFLEAGGILVESLAWLYAKTKDESLLDTALGIARYSYRHRGEATGLVINEPDHGRWDSKVCTSEVGLWAQSLLRAAEYSESREFADMARAATRAYLEHAWDERTGRYSGQVSVVDGTPVVPGEAGYWPREHANPYNSDQWPTHDYPMAVAEACVTLHACSGEDVFRDAIHRWARIAADTAPAREGPDAVVYAESYGRCIHFLARAGKYLGRDDVVDAASGLAGDACVRLLENEMFQGYPESHAYESVDGVGYLFLALMLLETGGEADLLGFGF